jgi:hypothetical protein
VAGQIRELVRQAERESLQGIDDRAADTYEPLAVIARIAGEDWPDRIRAAAEEQTGGLAPTGATQLMPDVIACFHGLSQGKMFSRDLAAHLMSQKGQQKGQS